MKIKEDTRKRRVVNKRVMLTMFALLIVSIWVGPAQSASDLALYKYAPSTVGSGKIMNYTLSFYNSGNGIASNVILNDTLPLNVDFISASNGGTYDSVTRNVTWNLGDIPPYFYGNYTWTNMSNSRTVNVSIPSSVPVGTVITNTAYISTTTPEIRYDDNNASAQTTVRTPAPNLALYKYAPAGMDHGKNIAYTLSFYNFGDEIASNVVLNDVLPLNVDFISASNGGTYDSVTRSVTWNLGDILPFTSDSRTVTVSIPGSVPVGTVITNIAYISTTTPEIRYDDNSASAQTTVTSSTLPDNVNVGPTNGNWGGTTTVNWGTPITFSYHSCPSATAVDITIHVDGFPDIIESMTGPAPDWTYTTTFYPRHGQATITLDVTGCEQKPVVFIIYIDPAGYIYDVTTGLRISGATVTLQRFNISTASWENVPTGPQPPLNIPIMDPDMNPLTTGIDGQYQWNTTAGTYRVHVTAPGYNPADSRVVTVPPPVTDLHVGLTPNAPIRGGISGMKFNDLNGNGIKDMGEPGLANWTITLTNQTGNTVNTMTDANGNYSFTDLPNGNYTIGEILKPGWIQKMPSTGTYTVTITSGEVVKGLDFGNMLNIPQVAIGNVTGGGWIISPTTPAPKNNNKATFGFVAHYTDGSTTPSGNLQYTDQVSGMDVHGNVTTLSVNKTSMNATFTGTATINGAGAYAYTVKVHDGGEPGKMVDHFEISILGFMAGYSANDALGGGNIQIHDP